MLTRRGFFGTIAAAAAAAAYDPERLLWVPGRKLISIPAIPWEERIMGVMYMPDTKLPLQGQEIDAHGNIRFRDIHLDWPQLVNRPPALAVAEATGMVLNLLGDQIRREARERGRITRPELIDGLQLPIQVDQACYVAEGPLKNARVVVFYDPFHQTICVRADAKVRI